MSEITLTLETVTPLFLGGADPRGQPELRPPSFRGAMRYWLRAALGGAIGDSDMDGLHRLEEAVFGSTASASPICLRVSGDPAVGRFHILPHKNGGVRQAFRPGETLNLTLWQELGRGAGPIWEVACAALNLMLTCGGVGLRSRRGYGTLRIVHSSCPELVPASPRSLREWRRRVEAAITGALAAARSLAQASDVTVAKVPQGPAQFPCLCNRMTARVYDLRARSAMDATRDFMSKVPKDAAFGGIRPRQASPLWVRPIATGQHYGLLFTILPSRFPSADYSRIEKFLKANFSRQHAV